MASSSKAQPLMAAVSLPGAECARGERRRFARRSMPASPPVVELAGEPGIILDLSEGGMRVQAAGRVQVAPNALLSFTLPGSETQVAVHCALAWAEESGQAGLRFLAFPGTGRTELGRWVAGSSAVLPELAGTAVEAVAPPPARELLTPAPVAAGDPALEQIVHKMMVVTAAEGAAIALRRGEQVVCRAAAGNAPAVGVALNPESGLSGECLRRGAPVLCADTEGDARVNAEACRQLRLRSALLVPVWREDKVEGVLEVFSSKAEVFDRGDLLALIKLAEVVAAVSGVEQAEAGVPDPAAAVLPPEEGRAGAPVPKPAPPPAPPEAEAPRRVALKLPVARQGVIICDGCGHPNPEWATCCERCDIPLRIPGVPPPPAEDGPAPSRPVFLNDPKDRRRPLTKCVYWTAKLSRHALSLATLTVPLSYFAYFLLGPVIRTESLQGTVLLDYMSAVVEPGMRLAAYFFAFRGVVHGWNFMFVIVGVLALVLRYLVTSPLMSVLRRAENMTRPRKPLPYMPFLPHRTEFR